MERIKGVQSFCCLKLGMSRATKVSKRGNITHLKLSSDCHKTLKRQPQVHTTRIKIATIVSALKADTMEAICKLQIYPGCTQLFSSRFVSESGILLG